MNRIADANPLPKWVELVCSAIEKNRIGSEFLPASQDLVLKKLEALARYAGQDRVIKFPDAFSAICPAFCLSKSEAWAILRALNDTRKIQLVPCHGVRIRQF